MYWYHGLLILLDPLNHEAAIEDIYIFVKKKKNNKKFYRS